MCLSIYLYEDLVQVPLPVRIRSHPTDSVSRSKIAAAEPRKHVLPPSGDCGHSRKLQQLWNHRVTKRRHFCPFLERPQWLVLAVRYAVYFRDGSTEEHST